MSRTVAAIVFDMDGTLFDSSSIVPDAYMAAVAALSGPRVRAEEVIAAYPVGPPVALLAHLLGRPVAPEEVTVYHQALGARAAGLRPYAGIPEAVAELRRRVPLAVFTGADRIACEMLMRAAGLAASFAALVGTDEIERPKPEPDGILEACRRLGVQPDAAAYVGDSPIDLEAARRSGALAVAAAWGHQYRSAEPADVRPAIPEELLSLVA